MARSVRLDEKLTADVERQLSRTGKTFSEYTREALAEKIARDAEKKSAYELGKHLFGKFSSGRSDLSVNYKKILREKLRAKHSR